MIKREDDRAGAGNLRIRAKVGIKISIRVGVMIRVRIGVMVLNYYI